MARSYSSDAYGGHQTIVLRPADVSLTTAASGTTVAAHTFMYPAKVLDCNLTFLAAVAEDLGTSTVWTLAKSLGGTGTAAAFGTIDVSADLATSTYALGATIDGSCTETSFVAGDDVLFQIEGTVGSLVSFVQVNIEAQEVFVESDS